MTIRKMIFKLIRPIFELFKKTPQSAHVMFAILEKINMIYCEHYLKLKSRSKIPSNNFNSDVFLICIAFNNSKLIKKQIQLFKKNVSPNHILVIADNSSSKEKRGEIEKICQDEKIIYLNLPKNPRKQVNLSHSLALNWVYYNFILKTQPFGFGFIDHDIFPLERINIKNKLEHYDVYGLKQERKNKNLSIWYLWAGFCFYKTSFMKMHHPNFSSVVISNWYDHVGLDTGGGNFEQIYKYNIAKVLFAECSNKNINLGELIDTWYHIGKASFISKHDLDKIIEQL